MTHSNTALAGQANDLIKSFKDFPATSIHISDAPNPEHCTLEVFRYDKPYSSHVCDRDTLHKNLQTLASWTAPEKNLWYCLGASSAKYKELLSDT